MNGNRENCTLRVEVSLQTTTWLTSHANDFGNAINKKPCKRESSARRVGGLAFQKIDICYIILHYVTYHFFSVGLKNRFRHVEKIKRKSLIRLSAKRVSFNFCWSCLQRIISTHSRPNLHLIVSSKNWKVSIFVTFLHFCPRSLLLSNFIVKRRRVNLI